MIDKQRRVLRLVEVNSTADGLDKALSAYWKLTCIGEAVPRTEGAAGETEQLGHRGIIVCLRKARMALENQRVRKKTDKPDAPALAELCLSGWYEAVYRKSEKARNIRSYIAGC